MLSDLLALPDYEFLTVLKSVHKLRTVAGILQSGAARQESFVAPKDHSYSIRHYLASEPGYTILTNC